MSYNSMLKVGWGGELLPSHPILCVCESVYLPENEDLVPTSYIQTVDAPPNVDVRGLGR